MMTKESKTLSTQKTLKEGSSTSVARGINTQTGSDGENDGQE